ncbi:hypothetical protein NESM_000661000 [Novymonas esmeraldas]|uniref:Uncharacterized protein n=1 Tax=Novymonas esmeraldas TaxID=1808958 RepID=A0AAW0EVK4_9TRYP
MCASQSCCGCPATRARCGWRRRVSRWSTPSPPSPPRGALGCRCITRTCVDIDSSTGVYVTCRARYGSPAVPSSATVQLRGTASAAPPHLHASQTVPATLFVSIELLGAVRQASSSIVTMTGAISDASSHSTLAPARSGDGREQRSSAACGGDGCSGMPGRRSSKSDSSAASRTLTPSTNTRRMGSS